MYNLFAFGQSRRLSLREIEQTRKRPASQRHRGQPRSIMSCGHDTGDSPRYRLHVRCDEPHPPLRGPPSPAGKAFCKLRPKKVISVCRGRSAVVKRTERVFSHNIPIAPVKARPCDEPHPSPTAPPVSLRLGHAAVLTVHRTVIHYRVAASLPSGEGCVLVCADICPMRTTRGTAPQYHVLRTRHRGQSPVSFARPRDEPHPPLRGPPSPAGKAFYMLQQKS